MKVSNDYIQQYLKKAHTQTGLYIMAYSTSLACVTIEVLLFFAVVILDVVIYQLTYLSANGFKPFHRGFFCNDPDIMKPWMPERLSFVGIVTGGTVLSVLMIAAIEVELYFKQSEEPAENEESESGSVTIPSGIIRMLHRMGVFASGLGALMLLCQVVAIFSGRLRPHFLAVCQPNTTLFNCSDGYITHDVCTGDPLLIKHARLSFPSLHTAASAYCLVFTAICLQCMLCLKSSKILRMTIQMTLVLLAICTGLSRISRYYHHWTDILGGLIVGVVMARIVTFNVMKLFAKNRKTTVYEAVPDGDEDDNTSEKRKLVQ